jgi:hypothetical protein
MNSTSSILNQAPGNYPFAGHRVLHFSVLYSAHHFGVILEPLENLVKAFKLTYAKTLRCLAWPAKEYARYIFLAF